MESLKTREEIIAALKVAIHNMKNSMHVQDYETSIRFSERLETLEWLLNKINGVKMI